MEVESGRDQRWKWKWNGSGKLENKSTIGVRDRADERRERPPHVPHTGNLHPGQLDHGITSADRRSDNRLSRLALPLAAGARVSGPQVLPGQSCRASKAPPTYCCGRELPSNSICLLITGRVFARVSNYVFHSVEAVDARAPGATEALAKWKISASYRIDPPNPAEGGVGEEIQRRPLIDLVAVFRGPSPKHCCPSATRTGLPNFGGGRSEKICADRAQNHRQIRSAIHPARCASCPLYGGPPRADSPATFWRAP